MKSDEGREDPRAPWWMEFPFVGASPGRSAPRTNDPSDRVEQIRSLFRLRLTAGLGIGVTVGSAVALMSLLGLTEPDGPPGRTTIDLKIFGTCGQSISPRVSVDAYEEFVRVELRTQKSTFSGWVRADIDDPFKDCEFRILSAQPTEFIVIPEPGYLSKDRRDGALPVGDFLANPATAEPVSVDFRASDHAGFSGVLFLEFPTIARTESFGRHHIGVDFVFSLSGAKIGPLDLSVSLPDPRMVASTVRPDPRSIGNSPVETYRFEVPGPEQPTETFVSGTYFIAFVDPDDQTTREALILLFSTLFGAGVSALLEAFLAGGTRLWTRASGSAKPVDAADT